MGSTECGRAWIRAIRGEGKFGDEGVFGVMKVRWVVWGEEAYYSQ